MKLHNSIAITLLFLTNMLFAQNKEVNTLLEKVHQAPNVEVKKELIEELKEKLAIQNKKAREEADAIIKAKSKIPLKIYTEK
jgi:hypothetical protein